MEKCIRNLSLQQPVELQDRRSRRVMKPTCYILFYKVNSAAMYDADFLADFLAVF
jgi:hypothetical protein